MYCLVWTIISNCGWSRRTPPTTELYANVLSSPWFAVAKNSSLQLACYCILLSLIPSLVVYRMSLLALPVLVLKLWEANQIIMVSHMHIRTVTMKSWNLCKYEKYDFTFCVTKYCIELKPKSDHSQLFICLYCPLLTQYHATTVWLSTTYCRGGTLNLNFEQLPHILPICARIGTKSTELGIG